MSEVMQHRAHNEFVEEHDTYESSPSDYACLGLLEICIRVILSGLVSCFNDELCFEIGKEVKDNEEYEEEDETEQPTIEDFEFSWTKMLQMMPNYLFRVWTLRNFYVLSMLRTKERGELCINYLWVFLAHKLLSLFLSLKNNNHIFWLNTIIFDFIFSLSDLMFEMFVILFVLVENFASSLWICSSILQILLI